MQIEIGIIGGSGFYNLKEIKNSTYITAETPFGLPSEKILCGEFKGHKVGFLSRHGIGHRLNPSEVNYRANMFALKSLGAKIIISVTAVGSLKKEIKPSHLVIPDQYFDNTFKREKTFFENGIVGHVSMAEPACEKLSQTAFAAARKIGIPVHKGGTYFNMEGPQFSSKAESLAYRQLGFDIIGMTQAVEAKLAKELEMCFLPLAFVTDYDCWHTEEEPVTVDMVVKILNHNIENSIKLIGHVIEESKCDHCSCHDSLRYALMTAEKTIAPETRKKLAIILDKYIKE